jgi:hypothetical protein
MVKEKDIKLMNYSNESLVKSCNRLESGLRLGQEGIHACQLGQLSSPLYWSADEASQTKITKEKIIEKRKWLFTLLNDNDSDIACKRCGQMVTKRFGEVDFTKLGRIDLAATTLCNLRCSFCGYAKHNVFFESKYGAFEVLNEFQPDDVAWDAAVDFNGGEPALLPDLDRYLEFFASRKIRVLLYTNAVKFRQSIYDGLVNGTIQWVCTSLDAGTPSSFLHLKKRDYYLQVLENLTRYAHAGSQGGGMLAVKYIFCDDNCDDDNVVGFSYTMLAIRPQKVWLTFDFEPLTGLQSDSSDFGGYDYSKHISAYAKMFGLMKKHGLTPVHYTESHLATVSGHGKVLLEKTLSEINQSMANNQIDLVLQDSQREGKKTNATQYNLVKTNPLRIQTSQGGMEPWSLRGKRILLAPACAFTTALLSDPEIREGTVVGVVDRDKLLHGKSVSGISIGPYNAIPDLAPDVILVTSPKQHLEDILDTLAKYTNSETRVVVVQQ